MLAADLVGIDQLAVPPGGSVSKTVAVEPEVTNIGVMASLRDPAGKTWRSVTPVKAGKTVTLNVTLGPAGLAVATA